MEMVAVKSGGWWQYRILKVLRLIGIVWHKDKFIKWCQTNKQGDLHLHTRLLARKDMFIHLNPGRYFRSENLGGY
jgi:hypothetical protein